ncbi:transcription antitermination factor NusB [Sediminibacterium roseum]|uniref:Transcription antitermination protein NusB n=1 Tax=Sediminibacterium roseum TaxID=1978412 RepID=A0ABW9ZYW2_9BACT|nr:transcription antitermination factor NusB [Sediminibacterium roseum]NCI50061.1 transcription antitermination factor NusB [Sediminibacterium roseum]
MISRRNIRVKVMQLLYMIEAADSPVAFKKPVEELQKQLDKSRELFVYLLYFITEVARYAETSAQKRASRNLPTEDDLNVNIKIAGNEFLWQILENPSFKKALETDLPGKLLDKDLVKKLYVELTETDKYKEYIAHQGREKAKEKEIIKLIFTQLMLPNESFITHIEEHFSNWDDDADMMDQLMMNYIQKPGSYNLQEMVGPEKWQFARSLLSTTIEKKEYCMELIKPKLKNWDSDRIAVLDMVLMRMGVCELLYFETIPTKVTINEYIDLAKDYSTPQSGQFVNGILDNIHKEMMDAGKIQKVNFKNKA